MEFFVRFNLSILYSGITQSKESEHVFQLWSIELAPSFLYIYDCKRARQTNARRVCFTKELHGYVYSWKTKSGIRQKKKPGLIDQCEGAEAVADSAILVPSTFKSLFDQLFFSYTDILVLRVYEVLGELPEY